MSEILAKFHLFKWIVEAWIGTIKLNLCVFSGWKLNLMLLLYLIGNLNSSETVPNYTFYGKNRESRSAGVGVLINYKLIVKEHVDFNKYL